MKQHWACTHDGVLKMTKGKHDLEVEALTETFGAGSAGKAQPLGARKQDALRSFAMVQARMALATRDIEHAILAKMCDYIQEGALHQENLISEIRKSGPGYGIAWCGGPAIAANYLADRARAVLDLVRLGDNPVIAYETVVNKVEHKILTDGFRPYSTNEVMNAVNGTQATAACRFIQAYKAREFDQETLLREERRQEFGLPPINVALPYNLSDGDKALLGSAGISF